MKSKSDLELELDWSLEYKNRAEYRVKKALKKGLKRTIPAALYTLLIAMFNLADWFVIAAGVLTLTPLAISIFLFSINQIKVIKHSRKAKLLEKQINDIEECEMVQNIFDESIKRIQSKANKTHIKDNENQNNNTLGL